MLEKQQGAGSSYLGALHVTSASSGNGNDNPHLNCHPWHRCQERITKKLKKARNMETWQNLEIMMDHPPRPTTDPEMIEADEWWLAGYTALAFDDLEMARRCLGRCEELVRPNLARQADQRNVTCE